jgi:DUF917 family protein
MKSAYRRADPQFMTKVKHYLDQDSILRAACVEMGTHAGAASRPLTRAECDGCMVKNTVSQAWRLGRSVALANKTANIGQIGSVLVDALGGSRASRVLFSGKIMEVNRRLFKGHTVGEIVIKAVGAGEVDEGEAGKEKFEGTVTSKFEFGQAAKLAGVNACGIGHLVEPWKWMVVSVGTS